MRIFQDDVRRLLRRAIWYVRCVVGFSLVFAGLWGFYGTFGAWGLPVSLASIIAGGLIVPGLAQRLPRRWSTDAYPVSLTHVTIRERGHSCEDYCS